ncbi:FMN-binding glutamate synthase family protein [Prescottella agglutinans]|uniref:FMN-binding glutamate synthase family protein n=1 Tax=Prescottella agglutinans TaxID=1644129 RepID=A0A438BHX7_9NOCA|nr:FMN-binding glutamate synthase family protein [Prescottella agglutinans]RVW10552.1 FMN-binding glutamate synthase family protein [Prescottella agglutinans]
MARIAIVVCFWLLALAAGIAVPTSSPWWLVAAVPLVAMAALGTWDLTQRRHNILRNYPVLGHARFLLEGIRPEIQQYFIESPTDGTPFDRETRDLVYERAKGTLDEEPFGTERDVHAVGYEFMTHSLRARTASEATPTVRLGGPDCARPYDIALLNVSAMSFGALSANAIEALNAGAARGGFAHDTGEGAISRYHRKHGGDLIWEIASGYFGCRTPAGEFDPELFAAKASDDQIKAISIKLSQGAKPGMGGVLPGAKVTAEIAEARGVPIGETVTSPPAHRAFGAPDELIDFIVELRTLSGGKPIGFKLCVGSRVEFLAICKAMLDRNVTPDFIIVDGAEGGTGAGPVEFEDHMGMPLTEGLMTVHNALVGTGLRDRVKIGASGKVASGADIVKRIIQGADFTLAARAMMFAVGCIQAQKCHTNRCPVGVATQDPARTRALDVPDKSARVYRFQKATVASAKQMIASMGLDSFDELHPSMLNRRIDGVTTRNYAELYEWLTPGELLDHAPAAWRRDWLAADPYSFRPRTPTGTPA